ncbi:hypothetical protein M422DRAFT_216808, partial [Sphaerobolus stellatus SS14]
MENLDILLTHLEATAFIISPLFATNYYPTERETQFIDEFATECEEEILMLDVQIATVPTTRSEENLRKFESKYEQALGLLAPIRRLPDEVLGEIFCLGAYFTNEDLVSFTWESGNHPYETITFDTPPLVFLQVCKRWRRIALRTPQLW